MQIASFPTSAPNEPPLNFKDDTELDVSSFMAPKVSYCCYPLRAKFCHSKRKYCRAKLLRKRDKNASGRVRLNIMDDNAPIWGILLRENICK
jgi:hypothetical protein